jgi:serine/threonine protein kinase
MPEGLNIIFNNRYLTLEHLGSGGFGSTYLAVDTHLPSKPKCVVKQLTFETDDPELYELVRTRFQREAAILEALGNLCPQIPRLHACSEEGGKLYLVQDWIEGRSLQAKLDSNGALTDDEVRNILAGILPVLAFVHSKNVIHRDIKPSNIMLREFDGLPYLIDFGAVKEVLTSAEGIYGDARTTIFIGTPPFAPPEQHGGKPVFVSDLYSLGLTAICLLTGRPPVWKETNLETGRPVLHRLRPGDWHKYAPVVGEQLRTALDKAIQPSALDRFHSAGEMLAALRLSKAAGVARNAGPAPAGSTLARLRVLAERYNLIRETYARRDTSHRRELMTGVFSEMIEVCISSEDTDVQQFLDGDDWGMRLAAYVYIYTHPKAEDLPALVGSIKRAGRQPFVQHRGIEAVGKVLEKYGHELWIQDSVARVRLLLDHFTPDTLRHAELTRILKNLSADTAQSAETEFDGADLSPPPQTT